MAWIMLRKREAMERDRWSDLVMSSDPVRLDVFPSDSSLEQLSLGRRILQDSQAPSFPPPSPPPSPPPPPNGFATPDPIVVIILGILLFALICAAFLNSILRCLLRRRRLRAWRAAAEAAAANGHGGFPMGPGPDLRHGAVAHGLDPEILQSLPVLEFLKNGSSNVENLRAGDCSICLSEFSEKEKLRLLPKCSHIFHLDCIDMWLQSHTSCPVCRDTILEDNGSIPAIPAVRLRPEENSSGASLVASGAGVAAGAGAPAAGAESGLMLLIQDENGHSVAATSGSAQRDAPSFRLVAANPTGVENSLNSRPSCVPEVPMEGGQQDDEGVQLVPMGPGVGRDAGNAASGRSTAGSKTYFVFEAGYFFSGRWLASSSQPSATSSSTPPVFSSDSLSQSGATSSSQSSGVAASQSSDVAASQSTDVAAPQSSAVAAPQSTDVAAP